MLANSIKILKENYKFLFKVMFQASLVAFYLIVFANFLISSRTETQLTLLEYVVIGLQGSVLVFIYNFNNTSKSSFILSFLLWFFALIASDAFKQVFFNHEYNLLRGVLVTFFPAIMMTYLMSKSSKK